MRGVGGLTESSGIRNTDIKRVKYVCFYVIMQYRQYAAVLLRKRLVKLWKKLDDETHNKYTALIISLHFASNKTCMQCESVNHQPILHKVHDNGLSSTNFSIWLTKPNLVNKFTVHYEGKANEPILR